MQKADPYTKLFNTLTEVRVKYFCSGLIKPYYTNMAVRPLFTFHALRPFHAFSNELDFIEAKWSIYQNVQYLIWSNKSVINFTAVKYLFFAQVQWNDTVFKMTIHGTRVTGFLCNEFIEVWKIVHQVVRTSF